MIFGIQILGILFAIIMLYVTYLYYKKGSYSETSTYLWITVWVAVIIIFLVPGLIYGMMNILEIERTADFFSAAGIIFLTTIVFYLYGTVKKQEKKIEKLVRKIALENKSSKK